MNYEIPAETVRLLKKGREIARRHNLRHTSPLCLLMSLINDEEHLSHALKGLGVDVNKLRTHISEQMKNEPHVAETVSTAEDAAALPDFDSNSQRIVKLSVLEDRLGGGKRESDITLALSMLHDRENTAKSLLQEMGVTYEGLINQVSQKPQNAFSFPEETDTPYPEDNGEQGAPTSRQREPQKKSSSDTPIIDNFSTDLTALATKGALDPVVGREREILRVEQILCRRKKNNPIIIGEPGVGKSAIVEGLAQCIAHHRVPHLLMNKRVVALNMTTVVAGTQYRGQFEERLRRLIQELKAHPEIIIFIDEIHTIIGAGSAAGSLDAANILKPALARGEVQCIGATTINEFKKSIEKDGALDRRFQKVQLEPTTSEQTLAILQNIKSRYEEHHNVTYTPDALEACVSLTARYITSRALPDKAIDALDEAGARMHLAGTSIPQEILDKEKEIDQLRKEKQKAALEQNYEQAANLRDRVQQLTNELDSITRTWQKEQRAKRAQVDETIVAEVVSMMSGVPVTRVAASENERLSGMKDHLCSRVIAQDRAVEKLTRAIMRSRLGLKGLDRPIGTFMFVGPTGVGKTHLVKCLAEYMFGTKDALIRIDMSEYGEKHTVSRLVGAPPGYVGYEEGGQLTERVRRKPYSVILLDEIEKAHPDVFNTLLQLMDEGRMTDGNGTTIDFRNTIIVMTSNSGSRQLQDFGRGLGFSNTAQGELTTEEAESVVMKSLRKQFAPEFLNRLDDVIMFNPLNKDSAAQIADIELSDLAKRVEQGGHTLTVSTEAKEIVVEKGFQPQYGARSLKRAIQQYLEDPLCDYLMTHTDAQHLNAVAKDGKIEIEE